MKKTKIPQTRVKKPEPDVRTVDWIIWAAWADRITFEEIFEKTGKKESEVIKIMRRTLKPKKFSKLEKKSKRKINKTQKLV